jgi:hypothetical protein
MKSRDANTDGAKQNKKQRAGNRTEYVFLGKRNSQKKGVRNISTSRQATTILVLRYLKQNSKRIGEQT